MIASASSRWPFPSTPATPTISPARTSRRRRCSLPRRELLDQHRVAESTWGFSSRNSTGRPTIISASSALEVAARRRLADHRASSQDGDPVGDLQHLVQLVADEHDRLAIVAEPAQVAEEIRRLGRCQHRRRFVEDQDLGAPVQRLQDLDPLLFADGEVFDDRAWIDLEPVGSASAATFACSSSTSMTLAALLPRMMFSVTVNGSTSTKCWWTMPIPSAIASRGDRSSLLAPTRIRPPSGGYMPYSTRIERRLAGAVLADQRVDLAGAQLQRHVVVRETPGKRFVMRSRATRGGALARLAPVVSITRLAVARPWLLGRHDVAGDDLLRTRPPAPDVAAICSVLDVAKPMPSPARS